MAGIYIHIPFCASRCSYCDFFSTLRLAEWGARYVEAVIAEARLRCHELRDEAVTTLYLGGGTPSQLPLALLARLVNGLNEVIDLGHVGEFTVEANPDDVTPEWCAAVKALGVNRVSMGVQSFEDHILELIGRRHNAAQVTAAIDGTPAADGAALKENRLGESGLTSALATDERDVLDLVCFVNLH